MMVTETESPRYVHQCSRDQREKISELTIEIKKDLAKTQYAAVECIKSRFKIGENLKTLAGCYKVKTKRNNSLKQNEFLSMIRTTFGIRKRSYYYVQYHTFLETYKRFQHCPISFRDLQVKMSIIQKWFQSSTCLNLPITDIASVKFWKHVPSHYQSLDSVVDCDDISVTSKSSDDEVAVLSDDMDDLELDDEQETNAKRARIG